MRRFPPLVLLALAAVSIGCEGEAEDVSFLRARINGHFYQAPVAHARIDRTSGSNLFSLRGGEAQVLISNVTGPGTYALHARSAFFGEAGFGAGTVVIESYSPYRRVRGRFELAGDPAACAGQTPCPVRAEGGTFDLRISARL